MRRILTVLTILTACRPALPDGPKVIVLVIDGARFDETFGYGSSDLTGEGSVETVPNMYSELVPRGTIVRPLYNMGTTITAPAHAALYSGVRQPLANFPLVDEPGLYRPVFPGIGEEVIRQGSGEMSEAMVMGNTSLIWPLQGSLMVGSGFGEGSDWFFVTEAPNDPQPASDDRSVLTSIRHQLDESQPRFLLANLKQVDRKGHFGDDGEYVEAIREIDASVLELWDWVQAHEVYSGDTTLVVVSDHGRHRGGEPEDEVWRNHGDASAGDREIPFFMVGPGVQEGVEISTPYSLEDVGVTVAAILGIDLPWASGLPISEGLVNFDGGIRSGVASIAVAGSFVAEERYQSDPHHRTAIFWNDEQLSGADAWAAEAPSVAILGSEALVCWREIELDELFMPWISKCAVLSSDSSYRLVSSPESEVGPFWRPQLQTIGGEVYAFYSHNPDDIAEFGHDEDVAPRAALFDGENWTLQIDNRPALHYATGVTGAVLDESMVVAFSASPEGVEARHNRRIHSEIMERFPVEGVGDPIDVPFEQLLGDGQWRLESPALRVDGDVVELLALALGDDHRFVVGATSTDGGASWGGQRVVAEDDALFLHTGVEWMGDEAVWMSLDSGKVQSCMSQSGCTNRAVLRIREFHLSGDEIVAVVDDGNSSWRTVRW